MSKFKNSFFQNLFFVFANKSFTTRNKITLHRAVAPVIATLLLVAIAVVGGSIIFLFAQGYFSAAQVSGQPQIESIEIVGYDATDANVLILHDGTFSDFAQTVGWDGTTNNGINGGERIAIYLQNQSGQKVSLAELRVGGTLYNYTDQNAQAGTNLIANQPFGTPGGDGWYWVIIRGDTTAGGIRSDSTVAELEGGQEATIIVDLLGGIQDGRDTQFWISSGNGNVFVGTIIIGTQRD